MSPSSDTPRPVRDFASDNHSGAHPEVIEAILRANEGHAPSYGDDGWTRRMEEVFRERFGEHARAFCVFNGSGANVAAVDALTREFEAVICTDVAHLNTDECGAPERVAGTKLLAVPSEHGKLGPDDLWRWEQGRRDEHRAQPRVVSITQASELGTVYTIEETRAIADAAHGLGMHVHLDGARLANAAAALGRELREMTTDAGVDVVSFGGTKNGLLLGDAVVFLRPGLGESFTYTRKQLGQLASKMRFLSAQLEALLRGDLWLTNAAHANAMAARLADAVRRIEGVEIAHPVEANAVFARLPAAAVERLLAEWPAERPFHVWERATSTCRWMCSWDTAPEDVDGFAAAVARALSPG
jgi:threonine aldolase